MPKISRISCAVLVALGMTGVAVAQSTDEANNNQTKPAEQIAEAHSSAVVVTATRTEKKLEEVPASIVVIDSTLLDQESPRTLGDAFLDVPNMMVEAGASPVFTRVSIRGSDSDQITYLIDGVRQDNYTMSGNRPAFMFVDPEMIKQIEVKRGGGASLYGNGGIGGTISVTTKTAADLLAPGQSVGGKVKAGYSSDAREFSESAFVYGKYGMFDGVIGVSARDGGKVSTSQTGRRSSVPRDSKYRAVTGKFTVAPSDNNLITLAYNFDKTKQWMGESDDRTKYDLKQNRITGSWEYSSGDWIDLIANVQYSKLDNSFDGRSYNPSAYFKDDFYSISANVQNTSVFNLLTDHVLTYGFDISKNHQKAYDVDGNLDTSRPDSRGYDAGLFIQDEIALGQYLSVTPVVRYSYYNRKSLGENNEKFGLVGRHDSKVSPGVTLTLTPIKQLSAYVSLQSGYRPPFLDELYTSMEYPDFNMYSIVLPNPDLKPEESLNLEVGLKGNFENLLANNDKLNFHVNAFRDRVKNLINAGATGEMDFSPEGAILLYYTVENVGKALKTGFEVNADYEINNFDFHFTYGYLHAKDETTGEKIAGITPQQATFRAGYTYHPWNLKGWYRLRAYKGGKSNLETSWGSNEYKYLGGFATHSVGLQWKPKIANWKGLSINASIDNIGNKKYRYLNGGYG